MEEVMSELYGVWFLIGAALVFWMQAGFVMGETGFTRAKNAGNILMKNLMDFCMNHQLSMTNLLLLGIRTYLSKVNIFWNKSTYLPRFFQRITQLP